MSDVDVVTVPHRTDTMKLAEAMLRSVVELEPTANPIIVDNILNNRGFAAGCNLGASQGAAPIIAFFNPDTVVNGPFLAPVQKVLDDELTVITGCRFGKPAEELKIWGVHDWVVGAAMFVRRDFWEQAGGFDEQFWLYFEETDLIRRAETSGYLVRSIDLPIFHQSPSDDTPVDVRVKRRWFDLSAQRYYAKWSR